MTEGPKADSSAGASDQANGEQDPLTQEMLRFVDARAHAESRNRRQILLFALMTIVFVGVGVAAGHYFTQPRKLVLTVYPKGGVEEDFANKLARAVQQNSRTLRVNVTSESSPSQAMALLQSHKSDIVLARSDAPAPPAARVLAKVEDSVVFMAVAKHSKIDSIADLKNKRVAVISHSQRDLALARDFFRAYEIPADLVEAPMSEAAQILARDGALFVIERRSSVSNGRAWDKLAHSHPFKLLDIDGPKTLQKRVRALRADTIEAGFLSGEPAIPKDDADGVGLDENLLVSSKMTGSVASQLAQIVIENKDALSVDGVFATAVETPDTNKDVEIVAHPGAADYVTGDVKTFFDRYSDLFYVGLSVGSVVASFFAALYHLLTRVKQVEASELIPPLLGATLRARKCETPHELDEIEAEIDGIVDHVVMGLQNGSIIGEDFEGFRLAYQTARDTLNRRRAWVASGGKTSPAQSPQ